MILQNKSNEAITKEVWRLVDALPQREAIVISDARAWVDEVIGLHGEAAIWHAIRLNGFGGSEIGVLVRNHAGQRADHQASARDIVAGKLMRKAPTETSGHMTRGHENEEPHARRFYAKYGAARDQAAYDGLKSAQGRRPWMRYSPDDVVQMPVRLVADASGVYFPTLSRGQNHRWLIDYKAPSVVVDSEEVATQYACQLAQGAILCAEQGIDLDGMMLSQFDWANWTLKDDVVQWDERLGRMVLAAGDHYWSEFVLNGLLPPRIFKAEAKDMEDYKHRYIETATMYAHTVAMADAFKKRADEIRPQLLAPIKDMRLGSEKISFGLEGAPILKMATRQMMDREAVIKAFTPEQRAACSPKGKNVYDQDLMVEHLRSLGVDLKQFQKLDLNPAKVYAMAVSLGLDADALVAEQITMSPDNSIKEQCLDYVEQHFPLSAALVAREAELPEGEQGPAHEAPMG